MSLFWILILANMLLMVYAVTVVCRRVTDRRRVSRDRVLALRGAAALAIVLLSLAAMMYLGSDGRRYTIVRDMWHLGSIASAFAAALAIRVLHGDGPRDRW